MIIDISDLNKFNEDTNPLQFWAFNLFLVICKNVDNLYFYKIQDSWHCCFETDNSYISLIQPTAEFMDGIEDYLNSMFQRDPLSNYLANNCAGHLVLLINGEVVNCFMWKHYNGKDCYFVKVFFTDDTVEAALQVWDSYKEIAEKIADGKQVIKRSFLNLGRLWGNKADV